MSDITTRGLTSNPAGGVDPNDAVDSLDKDGSNSSAHAKDAGTATPAPPPEDAPDLDALFSAPNLKIPPSFGQVDPSAMLILIDQLISKTFETSIKSEKTSIDANKKKQSEIHKENIKKLKKAAEAAKKSKRLGLIGKILGWIVAAVALIASAIVAVATLGTGTVLAAGIACLGLAFAVTMTVLSATGVMDKMTQAIAKSIAEDMMRSGMTAEKAKKIGGILAQVIVALIVAVVDVVLIIASLGAATGEAALNFGSLAARMGAKAAKFAATGARVAEAGAGVAQIAAGTGQVAAGSIGIAGAQETYKADVAYAQVAMEKAILQKLRDLLDSNDDFLKELYDNVEQNYNTVNKVMKAIHHGLTTVAKIPAQV